MLLALVALCFGGDTSALLSGGGPGGGRRFRRLHRPSKAQQGLDEARANRLGMRLELQAEFYAGLWAHHARRTRQTVDPGNAHCRAVNAR